MKNQHGTIKNQPGTMKHHENRPGTMKNRPGTIKNQPGTIKKHENLQPSPKCDGLGGQYHHRCDYFLKPSGSIILRCF